MSLLTLVQDACERLSVEAPIAVVNSAEDNARLMLRLAKEEGRSLRERFQWQALVRECVFTTVAAEDQGNSAMPSDFDRFVNETMFNRTRNRMVVGPLSAQQWQEHKASLVTRVNPAFRIRDSRVLILPTPAAGETVAYEYVSTHYCRSAAGFSQPDWQADTDVGSLSERVMLLGLIWRYRSSRGLDYQQEYQDYERAVLQAIANDGGRERMSSAVVVRNRVPSAPQVPETLIFS